MRVVVTSPFAAEAFAKILRDVEVVPAPVLRLEPVDVEPDAVKTAVAESDVVIFVSGRSAYRLRELGVVLNLAGKAVGTAEGGKGAVMIRNAFGVEPQLVANTSEELADLVKRCGVAALFHHGERAEALARRLHSTCARVHEFYTYRSEPDEEVLRSLPRGDVYVFFSATAAELVASRRPDVLKNALAVAAGPAVAAALERYGVRPLSPPGGRIAEVALYVRGLLEELSHGLR
jgi:uroporphyrinogen-III synthase